MFDQLSDDVVRRIFHYLSVRERARFSSVNKRLIALFSTWDDVFYCSARLGGVSLAGEDFVVEIEKPLRPDSTKGPLESILTRCPLIRKLAIHDEHVLRYMNPKLLEQMTNVDELHIPSGLFARFTYSAMIEALFSLPKLRVLHIQQRYNEEKRQTNLLHFQHVENLVSTNISNMKLQGVAVTSSALEVLSFKYAKTMSSLCLIGSLMHTQDIDVYFRALSHFERLSSLTLPPSLYSISSSNRTLFTNGEYPSLRNLCCLRKVAMFVSKPDMGELKLLIGSVLPRTVEHLVLYDESHRLSLKAEEELKDFNLKVHFCGDYDLIVDNYWMNGRSELITQTIWKAPYQSYVVLQPTLPEWYCVISELMDTAIVKKMSSERLSTSSSGHVRREQRSEGLRTAATRSSLSLIELTARSGRSSRSGSNRLSGTESDDSDTNSSNSTSH
ncbi:hypothetical protein Tcan_12939 [Toxocara canis]|uniref:F-box domain-containing protein n=1 Tax=Toxocara canis TaxID=6265 RepID=A0A0B2VM48_TOXCA|nr:hypothetical protein Tcan_12939 [Toxocara canis]